MDEIVRGAVEEVVVSHKDRLCRFAFELFERLRDRNDTRLAVKDQENRSAESEFSEDLVATVHVFSRRHRGTRRYSKNNNHPVSEDKSLSESNPGKDTG